MPRIDLRAKPIAITGASSGIGMATALACAHAGMPVALGARRVEKLREVQARIEAMGGKAVVIACDVAKRDDCERFIDGSARALGGLYAAFANAGYGFEASVDATDDARLRELFDTNFWGSLWTIKAALPHLRRNDPAPGGTRGHLLWCSSCLSKIGLPMYAHYCASKAMQDAFARAMRHELRREGIAVSSVHPIGTRTEFFENVAKSGGQLLSMSPDRFMQPPSRVADAVVACLRKPRGEVWTSLPMRAVLGVATAFPALADWGVGRMYARRLARRKQP